MDSPKGYLYQKGLLKTPMTLAKYIEWADRIAKDGRKSPTALAMASLTLRRAKWRAEWAGTTTPNKPPEVIPTDENLS